MTELGDDIKPSKGSRYIYPDYILPSIPSTKECVLEDIEQKLNGDIYEYPTIVKYVRNLCISLECSEVKGDKLFNEVNLHMSSLILSKPEDDLEVIEYAELLTQSN